MSTLLEREKVEETTTTDSNSGDHDRFSHFFKKADVDNAIFTGKPAKALCGKMDVPMRPTEGVPVCPTCQEIYNLMKG